MTKKIALQDIETNDIYLEFELEELEPYSFCVDANIYSIYTYTNQYGTRYFIGMLKTLFEYFRQNIQFMSIYNDDMDAYLKTINVIRNLDVEHDRYISIELKTNDNEIYEDCFLYLTSTNYDDDWLN